MAKSAAMKELLDEFGVRIFGISRTEALSKNICIMCKEPAGQFRTVISAKEYNLSALCQSCQDKTFEETANASN